MEGDPALDGDGGLCRVTPPGGSPSHAAASVVALQKGVLSAGGCDPGPKGGERGGE
eukprot:gene24279-28207_t